MCPLAPRAALCQTKPVLTAGGAMKSIVSLLAAVAALSAPARAEVVASTDDAFVIRLTTEVAAAPVDAWRVLVSPAQWWDGQHTYSGDAANLYIDSQATGCFCEKLPHKIEGMRPGSIEHMHIVYAEPGRVLRMTGGLGPLQGEAVVGTLTMTLKPVDGGTRILWEYVVGGYMRQGAPKLAPLVDKVMAGQIGRLGAKIGPLAAPAAPATAEGEAPTAEPTPSVPQ